MKADSDAASQLGLSIDDLHPIDELHGVHLLSVDGQVGTYGYLSVSALLNSLNSLNPPNGGHSGEYPQLYDDGHGVVVVGPSNVVVDHCLLLPNLPQSSVLLADVVVVDDGPPGIPG